MARPPTAADMTATSSRPGEVWEGGAGAWVSGWEERGGEVAASPPNPGYIMAAASSRPGSRTSRLPGREGVGGAGAGGGRRREAARWPAHQLWRT